LATLAPARQIDIVSVYISVQSGNPAIDRGKQLAAELKLGIEAQVR
jgi:hypothetical protein